MARAANDKELQQNTPDEISKKDLLRETGISYGQFYRWKRMGLIPEAWFRRRSTFTGQETFLPRQKLLERIRRIHDLRDRYSLEDIAVMLSPDVAVRNYPSAEVGKMEWISQGAHTLFARHKDGEDYSFLDLVALRLIERLLAQDVLSDDQIELAVETLQEKFNALGDASAERRLTVAVQSGLTGVALHTGVCLFDSHQEVVASIDLNQLIEQLKVFLPQTRE